jgi:hypothetical protein
VKIVKKAAEEKRVKLYLSWEHNSGGCMFPCNAAGEVDHSSLTTAGLRNLIDLRRGKHASIPATIKPVIIQREYTVKHHAVGLCECGQRVTLDGETITCKCGRQYSVDGKLIAQRRELLEAN